MPTNPTPPNPVPALDDLVVYLKLPKSTVYKLAQGGKLPGQKVGRHWRFHRETVDRWLAEGRPELGAEERGPQRNEELSDD